MRIMDYPDISPYGRNLGQGALFSSRNRQCGACLIWRKKVHPTPACWNVPPGPSFAFAPARTPVVLTHLIRKRTIGADHRLRPFQIVPRLKCQPVEGGGVEGEGEAEGDLGGDGEGVGDEGFDLVGGYAGAAGELSGVECARDEVGVQQDVAGGSQGLRGVHIRVRGELDQFHVVLPVRHGSAADRRLQRSVSVNAWQLCR